MLRPVDWRTAREIQIKGQTLLNFSSNDYLGLSTHPEVVEASCRASETYGTGSGASRLVSGNLDLYSELETRLAEVKQTECALVFPSGYHANLGLIPALLNANDTVILDRLAHASLVDAARLSKAHLKVFAHNQPEDLQKILDRCHQGKKLVLAESVYSMDGDIAPVQDMITLCEMRDALLILDDAHGFGVIGSTGRGIQETLTQSSSNLIIMGTLSKAMGALGGYVTGPKVLVDYLTNCARTLIYTTALPPSVIASSLKALEILFDSEQGTKIFAKLHQNIDTLSKGLAEKGYPVNNPPTAIFPILIGEDQKALKIAAELEQQKVFAPAIRTPTVPRGTARIRVSVSALHKPEDLERLLSVLPNYKQ